MFNNFISYLFKFSLFYDLKQTKREMLKEFREDLRKQKTSQNPITVRTYEELNKADKIIINRYKDYYRASNNTVYLSHKLGYSCDGIKKRISSIANQIKYNIQLNNESVHNEVIT